MRPQSLKNKLLLAVSFMVIGSGLLISLVVTQRYSSSLFSSVSAQAENVAQAVALDATDMILTNDLVALQKMLDYHITSDPQTAYIFIVKDNQVLAHTFAHGIPIELLGANEHVNPFNSFIRYRRESFFHQTRYQTFGGTGKSNRKN